MSAEQRSWYNDKDLFWHGWVRSNYVTSITDWFMSFAGKWAELVLYATVLYSCAQLYPGVKLPDGLNLAVFLVQMGALDVGGLSLAKLARQAREDGNLDGAKQAKKLSKWLIGIMLVGVVTVGIEHVVTLPEWVRIGVEVLLVVARSVCSVLYGSVVHAMKQDTVRTMVSVSKVTELADEIRRIQASTEMRIAATEQRLISIMTNTETKLTGSEYRITSLLQQSVTEMSMNLTEQINKADMSLSVANITEILRTNDQALAELATLPERLQEITQAQLRHTLHEVKATVEENVGRPRLSLVEVTPKSLPNVTDADFDKGAFVRQCLQSDPTIRNTEIIQKAAELGIKISASYCSETRKAFMEETA